MDALTSIIIPTYNHAVHLRDAVYSALAQRALVEVIVIDDGSSDDTESVLAEIYDARVRYLWQEHAGVSAARNLGIRHALGEFVMFLDADDTIAPNKVARQLREFDDDIGWVLCDVRIEWKGRATTASQQYDYEGKAVGGWIDRLLVAGNFIPIMSPLVRRSVLGDSIRFGDELMPEDWHFWYAVAVASRCRYVPEVLATYRKQPGSRNTTMKPHPTKRPGIVEPLRLNLGCGTPDTRSWHPMPGLVNLDRSMGWKFEDGLGDFLDGSVAGITVSHALMYVADADWPRVFAEFARVLRPGGVLRITEDDTTNPASSRIGGWKGSDPAVILTDAAMVRRHMEAVGFSVFDQAVDTTRFDDRSLCQAQHGEPPDVFFVEGVRECCLFLSPHSDDETLFGAFSIVRYKPHVVIANPSSGDYGSTEDRLQESRAAVAILGGRSVEQWTGDTPREDMRAIDARLRPSIVFAPSTNASHPDHVELGELAAEIFGARLLAYHTYKIKDVDDVGKVRDGQPVPFEHAWIDLKRRALECYKTQREHPRARIFFDLDLAEYQQ